MTSRAIVNWTLLVLVIALAAITYIIPTHKKTPPPPLIADLAPGQVTRVHIERPGRESVSLAKESGHWFVTAPVKARANDFRINALLAVVQASSHTRFKAAGEDLGKFKLAPPRARLKLNDTEIKFGDVDPVNDRRYVQVGDMIHLIPDFYFQHVTAGVADFVSLSLLPADAKPVQFEFPGFTLKRGQAGKWTLAGGGRRAGAQAVDDLVAQWRRAEALEVKRYTPSEHHDTITVTFDKGHEPLRFAIVARKPELVLARADIGMAYHFTTSQAHKLLDLAPRAAKSGDKNTSAR